MSNYLSEGLPQLNNQSPDDKFFGKMLEQVITHSLT
jgi:hypothetical protein